MLDNLVGEDITKNKLMVSCENFQNLISFEQFSHEENQCFPDKGDSLCLDYFEDNFLNLVTEDDNCIYFKWKHMASCLGCEASEMGSSMQFGFFVGSPNT